MRGHYANIAERAEWFSDIALDGGFVYVLMGNGLALAKVGGTRAATTGAAGASTHGWRASTWGRGLRNM